MNPWAKGGKNYPNDLLDKKINTEILLEKKEVLRINDINKVEKLEFIPSNTNPNFITINGKIITSADIRSRLLIFKNKIPVEISKKFSNKEKLILDLPIILDNIGWIYSAYCQLHWLEGKGNNVEVPYDFPAKYDRTKETIQEMVNHLITVKYASLDEYNDLVQFSLNGDSKDLLYNIDLDSCQTAYNKSISYLKTIYDLAEYPIGNFNFDEAPPKLNFFRSYTIGSSFGDLDDLGGSFGRFSLRVYYKGKVKNQNWPHLDYSKFHLNITEIGFRFIDEFSFNGNQNLGYWLHDTVNSVPPSKFNSDDLINLNNSDYAGLSKKGIGKDFVLKTPPRYFSNEKIKINKDIIYFFKNE